MYSCLHHKRVIPRILILQTLLVSQLRSSIHRWLSFPSPRLETVKCIFYVTLSQPPTPTSPPLPPLTYLRNPWTASGLPVGVKNPPSQTHDNTNHLFHPVSNIF